MPSFPNVMQVRRPFNSATIIFDDMPCRLVPAQWGGRPRFSGGFWVTHYLDCDSGLDIRDGCSRTLGLNAVTFADGDEVRVGLADGTWRFVVVWSEVRFPDLPNEYRRVYLMRHAKA